MELMENTIKVSVVIPVYNTAVYLRQSVGSIINQTLHELQIIIVDDGSTDGSLDILNELKLQDSRIEVYALERNQGQSIARNTALQYVRGEYIYFMDSDDLIQKDALEICYNRCEEKQLQFVFFDGDVFCEEGIPGLTWDYHRTECYDEERIYDGKTLFEDMLNRWTHRAVPWLMFIKRKYLECIRLNFYPGIIHEDELFTVLLYLQAERIGCLRQRLVNHRVRSNSTMSHKYSKRNVDCYLTVVDECFKFANLSEDSQVKNIVKHYASYTLDKVFYTAHVLPYRDKMRLLWLLIKNRYLFLLSVRSFIRFII